MISHLNNHGATDRIAIVDMNLEVIPFALNILRDAGFQILGSLRSPIGQDGVIRLKIRGSALPEACATALHLVSLTLECEHYGEQSIVRIRDVEIVGPPLLREVHAA